MIHTGIFLFLLFIVHIETQIDDENRYLKRAKKLLRFEVVRYENVDNLDANGNCCSSFILRNVCQPCATELRYNRYDINDERKSFDIGSFFNASKGTFFTSRLYNIDTDKHLSFQIVHRERNRKNLIDVWANYSTSLVGSYIMNGVWGIYGNTILYYNIEIFPISSYSSYYSVTFRIHKLQWLKKEYSDGTCCQVQNSTGCDNACPFVINVYANDNLAFTSVPSTYNLNQSSYFVKAATGSTSSVLQQTTIKLKLDIIGYPSGKNIDQITINNVQAIPNRKYEFNKLVGTGGKLNMDIDLKYECRGYRGFNCRHYCSNDTKNVDCHSETGTRFCVNGASDLPTCRIFNNTCEASPCVNGGICSPLPSGFNCKCPLTFRGKFCEEPSCESECKNGNCVQNTCVCDANYSGSLCDTIACPPSSVSECINGGTCTISNGIKSCTCPNNTRGEKCEEPVCEFICQVGQCYFVENSNPLKTECVCANGFTGIGCDVLPLKLVLNSNTLQVVLISVFSITFVLSAKLFLIMLFLKFDNSVQMRPKKKDKELNDRPSSLAGL